MCTTLLSLFASHLKLCNCAEPNPSSSGKLACFDFSSSNFTRELCNYAEPNPFSSGKLACFDFSSSNFFCAGSYKYRRAPLEMLLSFSLFADSF